MPCVNRTCLASYTIIPAKEVYSSNKGRWKPCMLILRLTSFCWQVAWSHTALQALYLWQYRTYVWGLNFGTVPLCLRLCVCAIIFLFGVWSALWQYVQGHTKQYRRSGGFSFEKQPPSLEATKSALCSRGSTAKTVPRQPWIKLISLCCLFAISSCHVVCVLTVWARREMEPRNHFDI